MSSRPVCVLYFLQQVNTFLADACSKGSTRILTGGWGEGMTEAEMAPGGLVTCCAGWASPAACCSAGQQLLQLLISANTVHRLSRLPYPGVYAERVLMDSNVRPQPAEGSKHRRTRRAV